MSHLGSHQGLCEALAIAPLILCSIINETPSPPTPRSSSPTSWQPTSRSVGRWATARTRPTSRRKRRARLTACITLPGRPPPLISPGKGGGGRGSPTNEGFCVGWGRPLIPTWLFRGKCDFGSKRPNDKISSDERPGNAGNSQILFWQGALFDRGPPENPQRLILGGRVIPLYFFPEKPFDHGIPVEHQWALPRNTSGSFAKTQLGVLQEHHWELLRDTFACSSGTLLDRLLVDPPTVLSQLWPLFRD